jgi:SAM-dependent methyltransferase
MLLDAAINRLRGPMQRVRRVGSFTRGDFGRLQRAEPISRRFGFDRGQPVDRLYMERFLELHSSDVRGHVLEIADDTYTRLFGGDRVERVDVLHAVAGNPKATIVADLTDPTTVPEAAFDCVICMQTLHLIFDVSAAVATIHRALKPGGVLLATLAGISQISRYDMDRWGDYWRVTTRGAERLFETQFAAANVQVVSYGNVYAAVSFLHGLAVEELDRELLAHDDPDYQVLVGVRAVRGGA